MSIIEKLLSNEIYRFWKSDWSESIVVDWTDSPKTIKAGKKVFTAARKILGNGFKYERCICYSQIDYKATQTGLTNPATT